MTKRKPPYTDEENWDSNEWQGRSKKQVDSNNAVAAFSLIALVLTIIGSLLYDAITK